MRVDSLILGLFKFEDILLHFTLSFYVNLLCQNFLLSLLPINLFNSLVLFQTRLMQVSADYYLHSASPPKI
jgi:hypothetical protein